MEAAIPERFASALLKVEQAKKHIDRLEREITDFWSTNPYAIEVVGDPKNATGAYRIKGEPAPLPDSLTLTAGDAAHNLRSTNHPLRRPITRGSRRLQAPATPRGRRWYFHRHGSEGEGTEPRRVR
jgi:hypothetical protein